MQTSARGRRKQVRHRCIVCGREHPHSFASFCPCGGMIDVEYDSQHVELVDSGDSLARFFDLLPLEDSASLPPVTIGRTPCVHARRLGERLGLQRLYLKNETVLPTCSTKYRMAVVALSYLAECGVREICTSSTGNSSSAFANVVQYFPGLRINLFTAEAFAERVDYGTTDQVASYVLQDATFVEAFECATDFARQRGLVSERGFFNPGRREGLKLAFLEATDQIEGDIDWYVQAVSSAMGVYGTFKGARELLAIGHIRKLPRLLCVQQTSCPPMVRAWEQGHTEIQPHHIVEHPTGIAKAILRGNPTRAYRYMHPVVSESNGAFVAVQEEEIRQARRLVEDLEGISPCFSASTALAGLIRQIERKAVPAEDCVLVNLTGGDRPVAASSQPSRRLVRSAGRWIDADDDNQKSLAAGLDTTKE